MAKVVALTSGLPWGRANEFARVSKQGLLAFGHACRTPGWAAAWVRTSELLRCGGRVAPAFCLKGSAFCQTLLTPDLARFCVAQVACQVPLAADACYFLQTSDCHQPHRRFRSGQVRPGQRQRRQRMKPRHMGVLLNVSEPPIWFSTSDLPQDFRTERSASITAFGRSPATLDHRRMTKVNRFNRIATFRITETLGPFAAGRVAARKHPNPGSVVTVLASQR